MATNNENNLLEGFIYLHNLRSGIQARRVFTNNWIQKSWGPQYLRNPFSKRSITIMCGASWNPNQPLCGVGFVAVAGTTNIIFTRSSAVVIESNLQAKLISIEVALEQCKDKNVAPKSPYIDYIAALNLIEINDPSCNWRYRSKVQFIRSMLNYYSMMDLVFYPQEVNYIATLWLTKAEETRTIFVSSSN